MIDNRFDELGFRIMRKRFWPIRLYRRLQGIFGLGEVGRLSEKEYLRQQVSTLREALLELKEKYNHYD